MDEDSTERELRRLFRLVDSAPLPDAETSDEQLAEIVRETAKHLDADDKDRSQGSPPA